MIWRNLVIWRSSLWPKGQFLITPEIGRGVKSEGVWKTCLAGCSYQSPWKLIKNLQACSPNHIGGKRQTPKKPRWQEIGAVFLWLWELLTLAESVHKCELHPLIHTFSFLNSAQDLEKKQAEPKTPHFLSWNQDIVPWSQKQKCGLKYVIHSPRVWMEH